MPKMYPMAANSAASNEKSRKNIWHKPSGFNAIDFTFQANKDKMYNYKMHLSAGGLKKGKKIQWNLLLKGFFQQTFLC